MRGTKYNAFKADVYALGASLLHMATLKSPKAVLTSERLDEAVGKQVEALSCSAQLKYLLRSMLAAQEYARPTMQDLCSALQPLHSTLSMKSSLVAQIPPRPRAAQLEEASAAELVQITRTFLRFFEFSTSTWGQVLRLSTAIQAYNE